MENGLEAKFTLGKMDEILGEKLEIELPKNKSDKTVKITYAATSNSKALQVEYT